MMEKLVVFFSLLLFGSSLLHFQTDKTYSLAQLEADPHLEVIRTAGNLIPLTDYQYQYFTLTAKTKTRKKAYDMYKRRYSKIIKLLQREDILPNEVALVKSKVKSRHLTRSRQWQFRIQFAVAIPDKKVQTVINMIEQQGAKILNVLPDINYLQEKWIALKLFLATKAEVSSKIHETSEELDIIDTVDLDIDGLPGYEDSDKIESELEKEVQETYEISQDEENDCVQAMAQTGDIPQVKLRVVFKIGKKTPKEAESLESNSDQFSEEDDGKKQISAQL